MDAYGQEQFAIMNYTIEGAVGRALLLIFKRMTMIFCPAT